MSLATMYLTNLAKRAARGEAHPGEITRLPQFIDKTFGDGDGVLELSDIGSAAAEIGGDLLDKAESVISFLADFF